MNPKNTFLLVLLAGGLFAFIFFFERHLNKPDIAVKRVLPDFRPEQVSVIQIQPAGQGEIRAERTNGGWQLTRPLKYPAQAPLIEKLLQAAAVLTPRLHLSAQALKGHANLNEEYGFDAPQAILIFQQQGEKRQLLLGSLTAPGDEIYAQVVGVDGLDVIDADFFKKLVPRQSGQWRDTAFSKFKEQDFNHLTTYAGGALIFDLQRPGTNDDWHMRKPIDARVDNPKIAFLLQRLETLPVTRFISDDDHADLESYGLQPALLDLKFGQGTNVLLSLQFGKSPTNDESQVYARHSGQNSVVLVPRAAISNWLGGFQEFRDRHLVRFNAGLPEVIEVAGKEKFTLRQEGSNGWRVIQPYNFPVDPRAIYAFMSNLATLEVVRFVNDAALPDPDFITYGLTNPPARQYLLKGPSPNGATNRVMAEIDFGAVKDGEIYARRGDLPDESSIFAVKRDDFEKLPAAAIPLRERRIWDFTENDVDRVTIRQHGKEKQLLHLGTNHWSIAAGSQGMINELEVEVGAQELGFLEAEKWVERGDADRAKYGFTDQSLQLAVAVKTAGEVKTRTLYFGGVAPDGLRYGEVMLDDGQKWIFEFPAVTLDRLISYFNIQENAAP